MTAWPTSATTIRQILSVMKASIQMRHVEIAGSSSLCKTDISPTQAESPGQNKQRVVQIFLASSSGETDYWSGSIAQTSDCVSICMMQ